MSLTVAIPTMDRWSFLKKQLPIYLDHPKVSYVVICDENGNDCNAICEAGLDNHPKLRLYQNDSVLGVYGNKRQCFLRSTTNWVAVLDSDNTFEPNFFDAFFDCISKSTNSIEKIIYCAGQNNRLLMESGLIENRIAHFSGITINRNNWNKILDTTGWNFLLNDGNCIWPRSIIKYFPDLPEKEIVGTDSIFFMRQAIQAGYSLLVEPTMKYVHMVHSGSHWLQNAEISSNLLGMRDWKV